LPCDNCGNPEPKIEFERLKVEHSWIGNPYNPEGLRSFFVCERCLDKEQYIKELLSIEFYGCLNSMEVCRLLNGFEHDDFRGCYLNRKFAYVTRPERCNSKERGCWIWSLTVYNILRRMENRHIIQSEKTIHFDKRKGNGKRLDVFRFWFIDREAYVQCVEKQKLTGYL
jgi:hypothetical protein